jgi:hypothetical protein
VDVKSTRVTGGKNGPRTTDLVVVDGTGDGGVVRCRVEAAVAMPEDRGLGITAGLLFSLTVWAAIYFWAVWALS